MAIASVDKNNAIFFIEAEPFELFRDLGRGAQSAETRAENDNVFHEDTASLYSILIVLGFLAFF